MNQVRSQTRALPFNGAPVYYAVVALLTALAVALTTAAQSSAAPKSATNAKPTVVLVHGAWADRSAWGDVAGRLQREGYAVDVFPTPLRGLISDAAYLRAFLDTIRGPVVLVGHSYGGAVITNAATGEAQVKALVYIDAFAPAEGETVVQLATAQPGSAIAGDAASIFDAVPYPGGAAGDVDLYVKQGVFATAFANDLPRDQAAVLAAEQRPVAFSALVTPSGVPAWRSIPSWDLVGTIDKVIPPAEQLLMAHRANAHVVKVKASHLPMVSRPDAVAGIIVDAAGAAAK